MSKPWYDKPIAPIDDKEGFGALGEKYFEYLAVNNKSPRTIEGKRFKLRQFASWCGERDLNKPESITQDIAERYQRHLHHYRKDNGQPLSIATQRQCISDIKLFYRWLVKAGYLLYSPLENIEQPKLPKSLPKSVLNEMEAEKVLQQPDTGTATGLRDRAMMETLYSTGIRRSELRQLSINDVDRYRGVLRVTLGKGQKDRIIPIGERAVYWIDRYLTDSRPELLKHFGEGALFISRQGRAMSGTTITKRLRQYIQRAGIEKSGSVHIFRHTTATVMLEHGADIRSIQAMLGHEHLSTTQIYTQVAVKHLKEVHARTHPAKLKEIEHDDQ